MSHLGSWGSQKGSATRKIAEPARNIAVIPCYQDDARAINALIDAEFSAAGKRLTPAARSLLSESLGGDRRASRNEISKLLLYCLHDDLVDETHVEQIIGDASAVSTDEAVDAVLAGNSDALLHAVQKIATSKTPMFLVLQGAFDSFSCWTLCEVRWMKNANRLAKSCKRLAVRYISSESHCLKNL